MAYSNEEIAELYAEETAIDPSDAIDYHHHEGGEPGRMPKEAILGNVIHQYAEFFFPNEGLEGSLAEVQVKDPTGILTGRIDRLHNNPKEIIEIKSKAGEEKGKAESQTYNLWSGGDHQTRTITYDLAEQMEKHKFLEAFLDPPADAPVADAPVADAPVADAPVADAPVADAPVADTVPSYDSGGN